MAEEILQVEHLSKSFAVGAPRVGRSARPIIQAVDGISFSLIQGETLALVGESGSGKSTTARLIVRLLDADTGRICFHGRNILKMSQRQFFRLRPRIQMVFQDPYSSLNPRMRVGRILANPLRLHRLVPPSAVEERVVELLEMVGLEADHRHRYPHEFSGGQRQRISIARAMALTPELVIADEPVSALDVSVRAQILNLLQELQQRQNLTCLFIAHDLSVVHHLCHRVAVLYRGKIVELGAVDRVFDAPLHPYTEALLSAIPEPDPRRPYRPQSVPERSAEPPPEGCVWSHRCPIAEPKCLEAKPSLEEKRRGHSCACHLR